MHITTGSRVDDRPCPCCGLDRVGYIIDPGPDDDSDVTCGSCGYSAALVTYLEDAGASETALTALALSLGGP
jgi:hypothetical protein